MNERQKPPASFRDKPPCKDCTEKFPACHDNCPKDKRGEYGYQAWKAVIEETENKRKAYNDLNRRKLWQK